LDYLQDLGINAIEFMPWTTWPEGEFSWGYNPVSFFSVEYNYYNDNAEPLVKLRRLQGLINEMHRRGMHVIMDGVFNHADAGRDPNKGFAYYWLYMNPADCPFIGDFADGGYFNEFNFSNNCTDEFILDVCTYWIQQYGIDGIRFDYVKGYYIASNPEIGIGELILYIKKYTEANDLPNISLTLELLTDPRWLGIGQTNQIDADGCWYDPLMWEGIRCVNEGKIVGEMMRALDAGRDFANGKNAITYIENHDHQSIVQACGGRSQWWVTQPLAIALFTISGTVFLHNGQEFAEQYYFGEKDEPGNPRVMPRQLRWERSTDPIGRAAYAFYRQLIAIRKNNPVLTEANFYSYGADVEAGTVVYHRWGNNTEGKLDRYIIVLNFSMFARSLNLPFSENGRWENLLDGNTINVRNYSCDNYIINSHWGAIYRMQ
jgi:1,4-alpha-glucan branching enzyme